jgi:hypothetical protein
MTFLKRSVKVIPERIKKARAYQFHVALRDTNADKVGSATKNLDFYE